MERVPSVSALFPFPQSCGIGRPSFFFEELFSRKFPFFLASPSPNTPVVVDLPFSLYVSIPLPLPQSPPLLNAGIDCSLPILHILQLRNPQSLNFPPALRIAFRPHHNLFFTRFFFKRPTDQLFFRPLFFHLSYLPRCFGFSRSSRPTSISPL